MIKTNHKGIFYTVSVRTGKKTYYGRYLDVNKKPTKVNLGNSLTIAVKKFNSIKQNEYKPDTFNSKVYGDKLSKALEKSLFKTAFLEYKRVEFKKWSIQEQKTKASRFKKWILPAFGNMEIDKINYSHVQEFINSLDSRNELKEIKCSRKSQENIKSSIQSFFTFLKKENILHRDNPAQYVTIKPYDNHVPMTLTIEQISTFYQNILNIDTTDVEDRKKRLMLILMMHGRRLSDIKFMEKTELRFVTNEYLVPAQKSKDGKTHFHKMTDLLRREFMEILVYLDPKDNFLFTNPRTKVPYSTISKFFTTVKKTSGIPLSFRCQDFRHVVGTVARNNLDMPLENIRDVLGHGSVTTTEIYSEKNSMNSKTVNNSLFELFGLDITK